MVQINFALKEVNCKIVYYGPGMSGKTTNLEVVHRKAPPANKGELTSIATEGDRTLFFDFMPLDLGNIAGMRTKFQLYTVPGQVYYNSTRKLVLQGVDGIIFVADSQEGKMEENLESIENLRNNLAEYGKNVDEIPMVLQYNKRDMPNVMDLAYMNEKLNPRGLPFFEGVATTGEGVFPTLKGLSALVLESLSKEKRGAGVPPRRRPAAAAPTPRALEESDPEIVAAAASSRPAAAASPRPQHEDTFGPESELKRKVQAAQAQARSAEPAAEVFSGGGAATRDAGPAPGHSGTDSSTGGFRIRKGVDAFRTNPPEQTLGESVEARAERAAPEPEAPRRSPRKESGPTEASPTAESRPRTWEPNANLPKPRQHQAGSPTVQKFVLDERRGSPILLIALVGIVALAAGVILYSFNIF